VHRTDLNAQGSSPCLLFYVWPGDILNLAGKGTAIHKTFYIFWLMRPVQWPKVPRGYRISCFTSTMVSSIGQYSMHLPPQVASHFDWSITQISST
jgi:hypothetical protein